MGHGCKEPEEMQVGKIELGNVFSEEVSNAIEELSGRWRVDAFCHHKEMEDLMNSRDNEGWTMYKLIECDNDTVTLVWRWE